MQCIGYGWTAVSERNERTTQGYRRFRCRACGKQFNERSESLLNRTQHPSDVIALMVLWRLPNKLSLRDLPEMFLIRGIVFSHEAVRDWEAKLTPAMAEGPRRRRRGHIGKSWYVDETYIRVHGHWRYLYRAIDRNGALVDVNVQRALRHGGCQGVLPNRQDRHRCYPGPRNHGWPRQLPACDPDKLGEGVKHRTSRYLNNRLEQDHRGIKGRYQPMRGFECPRSAERFCRGYDELRNLLRPRSRPHQHVSANNCRFLFLRRTAAVMAILQAA